jgi:putative ABC transport system permease protein
LPARSSNKGDEVHLRKEKNGKTVFRTDVKQVYQVDKQFLDFLSIPMVEGNPKTALNDHYSIIITKRLAEKFFGNESALNKMLLFSYYGYPVEVKVTGVTENPLPNASIQFEALVLLYSEGIDQMWNWGIAQTFVKVQPGVHFADVEKRINKAASIPLSEMG